MVENGTPHVTVIIPALNDEAVIGDVVERILCPPIADESCPPIADEPRPLVTDVIVVDNGSRDHTGEVAAAAGARVFYDSRPGYGQACLTGVAGAGDADIVCFLDANFSAETEEIPRLLQPIISGEADLVVGSRMVLPKARGVLPTRTVFANRLAAWLMNRIFGTRFTDPGPFRAIRADVLADLDLREKSAGFPLEMQIKTLRTGCRCVEIPVHWREPVASCRRDDTVCRACRIVSAVTRHTRS